MSSSQHDGIRRVLGYVLGLSLFLLASGCEVNSFLDPSKVGRWERTPVVLPILDQLDVIDEPTTDPPGLTQVQPGDLIPTIREYIVGTGDLLTVTVYELLAPGIESVQTRRVDELGMIRLPIIGPLKAEGQTPSQIEKNIAQALIKKGQFVEEPTVSVVLQEQRQNTFSVIGESSSYGTAIGTYTILGKDFRLLDAMALARGVPGTVKKIYVIRPAPTTNLDVISTPNSGDQPKATKPVKPGAAPGDLIEDLLRGVEPTPATQPTPDASKEKPAPTPLTTSLDDPENKGDAWVNVDGKWVKSTNPGSSTGGLLENKAPAGDQPASSQPSAAQRIIEIPYDKLIEGDTRYNVVIRPNDVIRVPAPVIGNVYIGGEINRPGTYGLPGDRDLTIKQLVIAAGGLTAIGIPERTDLIRRLGKNQEATVRLNLCAIFSGTQPDIFLKPSDTLNIGTNFLATPLAIVRNGFRMSYGFGFVLDRNFDTNIFGPTPTGG